MRVWIIAAMGLLLAGGAAAQPPRSCEERIGEFRVYVDLLAASRARTELEAAQAVPAVPAVSVYVTVVIDTSGGRGR